MEPNKFDKKVIKIEVSRIVERLEGCADPFQL